MDKKPWQENLFCVRFKIIFELCVNVEALHYSTSLLSQKSLNNYQS